MSGTGADHDYAGLPPPDFTQAEMDRWSDEFLRVHVRPPYPSPHYMAGFEARIRSSRKGLWPYIIGAAHA